MFRYFVLYKPFGILSQFSGEAHTLKAIGDLPSDVYPVGRLDKDSEGLLLLTNDKALNHHLLHPQFGHRRTYLAQVEGAPDEAALRSLESGVAIKVDGKVYHTKPAKANLKNNAPLLPERDPPIRYRKTVPDAWVELTLIEGKNRQVRKMTAAVGYPTLRLVRWSMEDLTIAGFEVGEVREFEKEEIYKCLRLNPSNLQAKTTGGQGRGKKPFSPKRRKGR
ncbi:pseudouridine synthase [Echinicola vietnamensis]|uniref:Pseudouridine synthase n=1 Tax=Echinicola vietnamensis (strain DSM 17526 / LMG 23754 / KMM 6221) TaxID=926556 RepID=L0FYI1_ECHVK|nr:pseudouridine synthase [Echinicola vietnamensis]AGA77821.1 pseudouridine synthase family protein [Echinicola vietnamensis DSM 17526]